MQRKVCVVGSGLIGRNWAVLFARAEYQVVLFDIKNEQLVAARENILNEKLPLMAKYGFLNGKSIDEVFRNIVDFTTDLVSAVRDVVWIQIGVPESAELKSKVIANIGKALGGAAEQNLPVIASSSSTIRPSILINGARKLGASEPLAARFLVAHPVNPPYAIPVVELVPSPSTSTETMDTAVHVMRRIGMRPIRMLKEIDGFIVNRLQYPILNAAYDLYKSGVASAADIDAAVTHGLGLRWSMVGPLETIHLNAPRGLSDYCERYCEACIDPVMAQIPVHKWEKSVTDKMHAEMCEFSSPDTKIAEKCKWRDTRLMELARLKNEMNAVDNDHLRSKL